MKIIYNPRNYYIRTRIVNDDERQGFILYLETEGFKDMKFGPYESELEAKLNRDQIISMILASVHPITKNRMDYIDD
jgi:hypothetical protein